MTDTMERFGSGMTSSERLLAALAFIQGHEPLKKVLLVYDTRCRILAAAVAYQDEVPVALFRYLEKAAGLPDYIQKDRGMPLVGIARVSRVLSGGYVFDGLSLSRDPSVWRSACPRLA